MLKLLPALLLATATLSTNVCAQDKYPSRAVTVIVPQAAGGNIDTVAAAKAKADGYTLTLTTNSVQVINPAFPPKGAKSSKVVLPSSQPW